jgi:hypothetical protein
MNLTNQIQHQEYLNKQLNERLTQKEVQPVKKILFLNDLSVILTIFFRLKIMYNLLMIIHR